MKQLKIFFILFLCVSMGYAQNVMDIQYEYDGLYQLKTITYSDGTIFKYTYDKNYNLLSEEIIGAPQKPLSLLAVSTTSQSIILNYSAGENIPLMYSICNPNTSEINDISVEFGISGTSLTGVSDNIAQIKGMEVLHRQVDIPASSFPVGSQEIEVKITYTDRNGDEVILERKVPVEVLHFAQIYTDVLPTHRFYEEVMAGTEAQIIKGYGGTYEKYKPDTLASRFELAIMLARAGVELGIWEMDSIPNSGVFTDVPETHHVFKYVNTLRENGVILAGAKFFGDRKVSKAEACKMIVKTFLPPSEWATAGNNPFTDVTVTATESLEHFISIAKQKRWMLGFPDGSFSPEAELTRGFAIKVIQKAFSKATSSLNDWDEYPSINGTLPTDFVPYPDFCQSFIEPNQTVEFNLAETNVLSTGRTEGFDSKLNIYMIAEGGGAIEKVGTTKFRYTAPAEIGADIKLIFIMTNGDKVVRRVMTYKVQEPPVEEEEEDPEPSEPEKAPASFKIKQITLNRTTNIKAGSSNEAQFMLCGDTQMDNVTLTLFADDTKLADTQLSIITEGENVNVSFPFTISELGTKKLSLLWTAEIDGQVYEEEIFTNAEIQVTDQADEHIFRLAEMKALPENKTGNEVINEVEFVEMLKDFASLKSSFVANRVSPTNADLIKTKAYELMKALYGSSLKTPSFSGAEKVTADMAIHLVAEAFQNQAGTFEGGNYQEDLTGVSLTNVTCNSEFLKGQEFELLLSASDNTYISSKQFDVNSLVGNTLKLSSDQTGMMPFTVRNFDGGNYTAQTHWLNITETTAGITNNRDIPKIYMTNLQFEVGLDSARILAEQHGHCWYFVSEDIQVNTDVYIPDGVMVIASTEDGKECVNFEVNGRVIFENNRKKSGISNAIITNANGDGILVKNSKNVFIGACTVDGSGGDGIAIENSTNVWVLNNNLTNNLAYVVDVDIDSDANIFSNILMNNGGNPLNIESSTTMYGSNLELDLVGLTALTRHNEKHLQAINAGGYPNPNYVDDDGTPLDAGAEDYCNLWRIWWNKGSGGRPTPIIDMANMPSTFSLQDAIDFADAKRQLINSPYIRLIVASGTYRENVTVPSGVWLRGESGYSTDVIIESVNNAFPTVRLYGNTAETRFDGLTIRHSGGIGILIETNEIFDLYKCDIQNANIEQTGDGKMFILNNRIRGSQSHGIIVNGGDVKIINNQITNHAQSDVSGSNFEALFNITFGNGNNSLGSVSTNLETSNIVEGTNKGHYKFLDEGRELPRSSIGLYGGYRFDWKTTQGDFPKKPNVRIIKRDGKYFLVWDEITDEAGGIFYKVRSGNGGIEFFQTTGKEYEIEEVEKGSVYSYFVEVVNAHGRSTASDVVKEATDLTNVSLDVAINRRNLYKDVYTQGEQFIAEYEIINQSYLPSDSFNIEVYVVELDKTGYISKYLKTVQHIGLNPNQKYTGELVIDLPSDISLNTRSIRLKIVGIENDENLENNQIDLAIQIHPAELVAYPNPVSIHQQLTIANDEFKVTDTVEIMVHPLNSNSTAEIKNVTHTVHHGNIRLQFPNTMQAGFYSIKILRNGVLLGIKKIQIQ